jgi:predicted pyridoxine 5'-phosphate oxidase superfamily flavin-nucleotide-binding protein
MGQIAFPHPLTPGDRRRAIILRATSSDVTPAGTTSVVVYWQPVPGVAGYNLYRWRAPRQTAKAPLNGKTPIARVRSCPDLKALIPEGSREWRMLANAFSSASVRKTLNIVPHKKVQARLDPASIMVGPPGAEPVWAVTRLSPDLLLRPVSPCDVIERGLTADEEEVFDALANANLKIRRAAGLAYVDSNVVPGLSYTYELRGVLPNGDEVSWDARVVIIAGRFTLPDPPSGFDVEAGDRQVLATWNRNPYASSYMVRRSSLPAGPYQIVNEERVLYNVDKDVHGNDLASPLPGFLDWQRWDEDGLPIPCIVAGVAVDGPENYIKYYYQVASCDILGRIGLWSAYRWAQPTRSTPPMSPGDLSVRANTEPVVGLALSWRKVTRDVNRHRILDSDQTYRIYRAESLNELEDTASLPARLIVTLNANPTDPTTPMLSWVDADPNLVPPYGEKDFWYRIQCVDIYGIVSDPSAALSGRVPDTRPPGPTRMVDSEGDATSITVYWLPNSEPDLAGYQIYRTLCDRGKPFRPRKDKEQLLPCDFVLVGQVSLTQAQKQLAATGHISFRDTSVPAGSPLCYAYWVRAYDLAGNLYMGIFGCPAGPDEYLCQRLYEETPPPVPVLTGLKARNNGVLVEWIASPIQDLRAFHVYRSEKETGPLDFAGCVLTDGTVLTDKWLGMKPSCQDIPAEPDLQTVHGSFFDAKVEPNHIYQYRVSALDWLGNESEGGDLSRIPAVSTFTYSNDLPLTPTVLPPGVPSVEGCGLEVRWDPPFDPSRFAGFLVFRSTSVSGPYRQVSPLVQDNRFSDGSALRGRDYWYRVQAMDLDGKLSAPSSPLAYHY